MFWFQIASIHPLSSQGDVKHWNKMTTAHLSSQECCEFSEVRMAPIALGHLTA